MNITSAARWLGVLVVLCAASVASAAGAGNYTVQPPPGWEPIDLEQLRAATAQVSRSGTAQSYDMGFQPSGRVIMDWPYVLVQSRPGHMSLEDMKADLEREFAGPSPLKANVTAGLRISQPRIDLNHFRNSFTMSFTLYHPRAGTIDVRSYGFVGRSECVVFHCYARDKDWDKYSPVFRAMANSFQWAPGQEYQDWTMTDGVRTAAVPAALVAVVGGFFFFRKREPRLDN